MLFKYCGIIGLLVNIPITICITAIPPLPSPPVPSRPVPSPPLPSLPYLPPHPHPPSLPTLPTLPLSPSPSISPHPPSLPHVPSPPSLPTLPPSPPHPLSPILPSPPFPPSNKFIVLSSLSKALVYCIIHKCRWNMLHFDERTQWTVQWYSSAQMATPFACSFNIFYIYQAVILLFHLALHPPFLSLFLSVCLSLFLWYPIPFS